MNHVRHLRGQRGFTLIDMLFVVGLIGLLCSLALPSLGRARGAAQASSAIATLRVVNSSQLSFAITCGSGFYSPDLPTLGIPPPTGSEAFLPSDMASAATIIRSGYTFTVSGMALAGAPATCNGLAPGRAASGYVALADPLDALAVPRFFGSNADSLIYEYISTLNGVMPEAGTPASGAPIK